MGLNGPGVWICTSPLLSGPAAACLSVAPNGRGGVAVGVGEPRAAAASTSKLVLAAAGPIWKTGMSAIADIMGNDPNPGQLPRRREPMESSPCSLLVEW